MPDIPTPTNNEEKYYAAATGVFPKDKLPTPTNRKETYLNAIAQNSGGETTTNYNELANKPKINNVELLGNISLNDLNIYDKDTIDNAFVEKETGKGLSSNDYSDSEKEKVETAESVNALQNQKISDIEAYIGYRDTDIYGLEADFENSIFTRLAGAVGKSAGSDFNNVNAFGGRRRCNLADNGTVNAYYGDSGYKEDGSNGQVMVEQPRFFYKVVPLKTESYTTQDNKVGYHLKKARYYISDTPKAGFKLHPAFIANGIERDKIYYSAYEGSLYDVSESVYITDDSQSADFNNDKLSSIADTKPVSGLTQNLTRANVRKLAHNRGTGWELSYAATISASQLLMLIEYASFNMQSAIGNGVVNKAGDGASAENTGGTSNLGNTSGSMSNGEVSYRGEENLWGNMWDFVDGLNCENPNPFNNGEYGTVYVADHGFEDNTGASPYEDTDIHPCKIGSGYISAFGYNEKFDWLFVPTEVTGNSSLPIGDMLWNDQTGWRIALLGGEWIRGSAAGAFALRLYDASSARNRAISGRLVYIPTEVNV